MKFETCRAKLEDKRGVYCRGRIFTTTTKKKKKKKKKKEEERELENFNTQG